MPDAKAASRFVFSVPAFEERFEAGAPGAIIVTARHEAIITATATTASPINMGMKGGMMTVTTNQDLQHLLLASGLRSKRQPYKITTEKPTGSRYTKGPFLQNKKRQSTC